MVRVSLFVLILSFSAWLQAAAVAKLDRNIIAENETVTLTIELDSSKFTGGPDIKVLEENFDIYNQGKSTSSQWVNGKGSSKTSWTYTLQPKQAGVFTIPSFKIGKEKTQSLSLQVKRVKNASGSPTEAVFLEVETDKKKLATQEQLRLTIRLNSAKQLSGVSLNPVEIAQAKVIDGQETQYDRSINGRSYRTYEVTYFIYPQQEGELEIPAVRIDTVVPRSNRDFMWGTGQRRSLRSEPIKVQVEAASSDYLVAQNLHIEEHWSSDPGQLEVGDSIERTIVQKAQGALAEQLEDIHWPQHEAMRLYEESPSFDNQVDHQGNLGIRTDKAAIVLTKPGKIRLPAIEVPWFNSETKQQEVAVLPAIELQVRGQAVALPDTVPVEASQEKSTAANTQQPTAKNENELATASQSSSSWLWPLSTLLSLLVIALLSFKLYRLKTASAVTLENTSVATQSDSAWREFKQAALTSDAQRVRQSVLAWAKLHWPEQRVSALADIKRLCADAAVNQQLDVLDKALYQGQNNGDFMALLAALEQHKTVKDSSDLYPTV